MVRSPIHVALLQFDIQWENPVANCNKIESLFEAYESSVDLLVLPEMFATGFTMNVQAMSETMDGPVVQWLKEKALQWRCDILGSLIIRDDGQFYNRLIWVNQQGVYATYDKRHLFALAGEDQVFTPGQHILETEYRGWQVRPLICYDLRFPVWSRTNGNTDVLIYIANFPEKRRYAWRQLLIARAIENQCFVIGLNRIGWDGNQHSYSGDSMIIDPLGQIELDLKDQEVLHSYLLEDHRLEQVRHEIPFFRDADHFTLEL